MRRYPQSGPQAILVHHCSLFSKTLSQIRIVQAAQAAHGHLKSTAFPGMHSSPLSPRVRLNPHSSKNQMEEPHAGSCETCSNLRPPDLQKIRASCRGTTGSRRSIGARTHDTRVACLDLYPLAAGLRNPLGSAAAKDSKMQKAVR